MFCKNCGNQISDNAAVCMKCGFSVRDGNNYCANCGKQIVPGAAVCVNCGVPVNGRNIPSGIYKTGAPKSKIAAGLLAIFLGYLGVHNFYLGYKNKAIIQLVVSLVGGILTCGIATAVISIWALIEGIMILAGSINVDADGMPLE